MGDSSTSVSSYASLPLVVSSSSSSAPSSNGTQPHMDRKQLRTWLRKLSDTQPLSFKDAEELDLLLKMYDANDVNALQYNFDNRFKDRLALPDPGQCTLAQKHAKRNRTEENHPTDEGLLKTASGDFINASIIEGRERQYIATQHPLPSTMIDFWKMVLVEKPCAVVMLNKYDYDQAVAHNLPNELVQYWPDKNPDTGFIEKLELTDSTTGAKVTISIVDDVYHKIEELVGEEKASDGNPPVLPQPPTTAPSATPNSQASSDEACPDSPPMSPPLFPPPSPCSPPFHTHDSSTNNRSIECSKLRVESNGEQHDVWHIRCGGWKDQDAPDIDIFMDLWKLVEEKLKEHTHEPGKKHKLVVHCTGGVGRTGTFITIDIAGQELKARMEQESGHTEEFSIEKIIQFLRSKRMNMVGSAPQYVFCHRAALKLLRDKMGDPPLMLTDKPANE